MSLHNFPVLAANQKPSTLLSAMMAVVPAKVVVEDSWQFKMLFLSKLPVNIRTACLTKEFDSLM